MSENKRKGGAQKVREKITNLSSQANLCRPIIDMIENSSDFLNKKLSYKVLDFQACSTLFNFVICMISWHAATVYYNCL